MFEVNEELSFIRNELQNVGIDNYEGKRQQKRVEVLEYFKRFYLDFVVIGMNFKVCVFLFLKIVFFFEIGNIIVVRKQNYFRNVVFCI